MYLPGMIPFRNRYVMMAKTRLTIASTHIIHKYGLTMLRVRRHIVRVCFTILAIVNTKMPKKRPKYIEARSIGRCGDSGVGHETESKLTKAMGSHDREPSHTVWKPETLYKLSIPSPLAQVGRNLPHDLEGRY
jgi:hypothetical protein